MDDYATMASPRIVLFIVVISMLASSMMPGLLSTSAQEESENEDMYVYPFDEYFREYMRYADMLAHMNYLVGKHPDIAKFFPDERGLTPLTEFGTTWQGRNVWCIKVSDNPDRVEPDEPKFVVFGAHHAREWMSYEVPMYFLFYLLEMYGLPPTDNDGDGKINEDPINGKDDDEDGIVDEDGIEAKATFLVDTTEIYFVPMINPDGVEYDHEQFEAGGGSWRKNMRDNNMNGQFDRDWDGVDLNRNYPFRWADNRYGRYIDENGVTITQDSSNPRSGSYHGPDDNYDDDGDSKFPAPDWWNQHYTRDWNGIDEDPVDGMDNDGDGKIDEDRDGGGSEPETRSMEELMKLLDSDGNPYDGKSDVTITMSYHSYSELILWPWGYTYDPTPHASLFEDIGNRMADINGYAPMQGTDLYPTSGDSEDWFYGSHGTLAFIIELDSGEDGGFHPPPEHIIWSVRENLGVNLLCTEIADVGGAAKEGMYPSIEIGLPVINHTQEFEFYPDIYDYDVRAEVEENIEYLAPGTMKVVYRVGDGDWKSIPMTEKGEGKFKAKIPVQEDGSEVQYYITAMDVRGVALYAPQYAHADPYEYFVTAKAAVTFGDASTLLLSILMFYGIVWGGFYRAISFAAKAEKRKARARFS
jgi:murein tripeptide amidase MpaA